MFYESADDNFASQFVYVYVYKNAIGKLEKQIEK